MQNFRRSRESIIIIFIMATLAQVPLLFVPIAIPRVAAAGDDPPSIDDLIAQLGSESYYERDAAQTSIVELYREAATPEAGIEILDKIIEAINSSDPEIAARSEYIGEVCLEQDRQHHSISFESDVLRPNGNVTVWVYLQSDTPPEEGEDHTCIVQIPVDDDNPPTPNIPSNKDQLMDALVNEFIHGFQDPDCQYVVAERVGATQLRFRSRMGYKIRKLQVSSSGAIVTNWLIMTAYPTTGCWIYEFGIDRTGALPCPAGESISLTLGGIGHTESATANTSAGGVLREVEQIIDDIYGQFTTDPKFKVFRDRGVTFYKNGSTLRIVSPINLVPTYDLDVCMDFTGTAEFLYNPIPTLSEWAALIFGILLAGWIALYLLRRQRQMADSVGGRAFGLPQRR